MGGAGAARLPKLLPHHSWQGLGGYVLLLTEGALNVFPFIFFCHETIIWLVNRHLLNSIHVLYSLTQVEEIQKE